MSTGWILLLFASVDTGQWMAAKCAAVSVSLALAISCHFRDRKALLGFILAVPSTRLLNGR